MAVYSDNLLDERNGLPIEGAELWVYTSLGAEATLTDALDQPLTQPLTTDEDGAFEYKATDGIYRHDFWKNSVMIYRENRVIVGTPGSIDVAVGTFGQSLVGTASQSAALGELGLSAATGSNLVGFQQSGTGAKVRTQRDKSRDVFSTRDFCVGDGVTNDTTALQNALNAAAGKTLYIDEGTILINSTRTVASNTKVIGRGGTIKVSTANVTALNLASVTNVTIRDVKLESTVAGALANVSGITIDQSTYCDVVGCTITGFQWAGVLVADSSYVRVVGNTFGTMLGTVADASDIHVYYDSDNVLVADNFCFGGRTVGINVQDPGGAGTYLPRQVTVRNNIVGPHTVFGINVYIGSPAGTVRNSDVVLDGNFVEGITGLGNTSNGMGIYCVGNGLGGLRVVNNRVKNCCINTLDRTNGPAGITISGFGQTAGLTGTAVSPIVDGNNVDGMTQGDGILIVSSLNGVTLGANNATLASSNDGSGAGGATLVGQALRIQHSNRVSVNGGFYTNAGSSDAIFVFASDASITDISLANIQVKTATGFGLRTSRNSTYTISRFNVNGITGTSGGGALQTDAVVDGTINGFVVSSAGSTAADIERTTSTSFSNCRFSGTTAVLTVGTCTGSFMDRSNVLTGLVSNSGTGMLIERYVAAVPSTGTGAAGDTAINSTGTVGQPKAWTCSAAGTPGTWTSQGNL